MRAAAFTLPEALGSPHSARDLVSRSVRTGTVQVAVNATDAKSISPVAAAAAVEVLTSRQVEHVVLVNANETVGARVRTAVEKAGAPFLLVEQARDQAVLLRQ